jgi:hypothetical protein
MGMMNPETVAKNESTSAWALSEVTRHQVDIPALLPTIRSHGVSS